MDLFNKKTIPLQEKTGSQPATGGTGDPVFDEIMKGLIKEESAKMDAMNRQELIAYNAETRCNLMYAHILLQNMAGYVQDLHKMQQITIDTLNKVIKKQKAEPIK